MEIEIDKKLNKSLIAIPTFNESKNIKILLLDILENYKNFDVLVLDDSSPDGTGIIVVSLKSNYTNLKIIYQKKKSGIGKAHLNAIKYAKKKNYYTLITMDADLTHEPKEISNFMNQINTKEYALVVGSRFINKNSLVGWSMSRKILTNLGHFLTQVLLSIPYDATGGYRAYSLPKTSDKIINSIKEIDYEFFYESITIFHNSNLKIKEIPITLQARGAGKSKMSYYHVLKGGVKLFLVAIRLKLKKLRRS